MAINNDWESNKYFDSIIVIQIQNIKLNVSNSWEAVPETEEPKKPMNIRKKFNLFNTIDFLNKFKLNINITEIIESKKNVCLKLKCK